MGRHAVLFSLTTLGRDLMAEHYPRVMRSVDYQVSRSRRRGWLDPRAAERARDFAVDRLAHAVAVSNPNHPCLLTTWIDGHVRHAVETGIFDATRDRTRAGFDLANVPEPWRLPESDDDITPGFDDLIGPLDGTDRFAAHAKFRLGWTHAAIGRALGRSPSWVDFRMKALLSILRRELDHDASTI